MTYVDVDKYNTATTAEIVEVISRCRLVETASAERIFWRRLGSALAPGFYVVVRPHGRHTGTLQLGDEAVCRGPFRQRQDAEAALRSLLAGNARARAGGGAAAAGARAAGSSGLPESATGQTW
jgi:hypothetical protein